MEPPAGCSSSRGRSQLRWELGRPGGAAFHTAAAGIRFLLFHHLCPQVGNNNNNNNLSLVNSAGPLLTLPPSWESRYYQPHSADQETRYQTAYLASMRWLEKSPGHVLFFHTNISCLNEVYRTTIEALWESENWYSGHSPNIIFTIKRPIVSKGKLPHQLSTPCTIWKPQVLLNDNHKKEVGDSVMWFEGAGRKPLNVSFPPSVTETRAPRLFHVCPACLPL